MPSLDQWSGRSHEPHLIRTRLQKPSTTQRPKRRVRTSWPSWRPTTSPNTSKALKWKTPFQTLCEAWTANPSVFKISPHRLIPGPYTQQRTHERRRFLRWLAACSDWREARPSRCHPLRRVGIQRGRAPVGDVDGGPWMEKPGCLAGCMDWVCSPPGDIDCSKAEARAVFNARAAKSTVAPMTAIESYGLCPRRRRA